MQFAADDSLAEVHYTYSGDDYDRSSSGLRPSILGWRMGKDEQGMLHSGNKAPSRPALPRPRFERSKSFRGIAEMNTLIREADARLDASTSRVSPVQTSSEGDIVKQASSAMLDALKGRNWTAVEKCEFRPFGYRVALFTWV